MYLELTYPPPKLGANLLIEVTGRETSFDLGLNSGRARPGPAITPRSSGKKICRTPTAQYGVGLRYLSMSVPVGGDPPQ